VVRTDHQSQPGAIRCPIIRDPGRGLAELKEFDQLRSHLETMRVNGTRLQSIEFGRGAIEPDGRLDLCKQGLGSEGATKILSELDGTPIRHVLLGTNAIGSDGLASLATATQGGSVIETIYLGCNGITAETLPLVTKAVTASSSVRAVWLKRNPLGPSAAPALTTMIEDSNLHTLDLVATGLTDQCFGSIAAAIGRSTTLRHLFLSGNSFTVRTCEALADWVCGPFSESLHISANPLANEGLKVLADALAARVVPMNLSLSSTGITHSSAAELARVSATTKYLDLGRSSMARAVGAIDNEIEDDGLAAIASGLQSGSLQWLDIRHGGFTDAGVIRLAHALQAHHSVEYLAIGPGINRKIKADVRSRLRPVTESRIDWHITSRYR
jgi:hypothetical protein